MMLRVHEIGVLWYARRNELTRRGGAAILALLAFVLLSAAPVLADAVISLAYKSDKPLPPGTIVALNKASDGVEPASIQNVNNIFGAVVVPNNSLLTFSSDKGTEVQVSTSGVAEVLVSNFNGDIRPGDQVTASPIPGVGMKATENVKVIGTAQTALSASPGKRKEKIKLEGGAEREVDLGAIPVAINAAYYFKEPTKTVVPTALQDVANSLAGRQVQPLPIIISLIIFVVAMIAISSLVYGAIRGSIISVGRNPLSQAAVYRNLLQVSALILSILAGALVSIYMILTRM